MKAPLPALLILADSQDALTDLCGISLLERLRRIVRKPGVGEGMILSNSVESMATHACKSSWRRGDVALKFCERKTPEVTIGEILDCIGAMTLPLDGRVLIVSAGFYCDERRLCVLAERLLRDATQKHVLDFPAIIHVPIENWLVLHLCRTSIAPNQVTFMAAMLGVGVTLLYAFGYLWAGVLLALVFGVWDGLDGKLARLKAQTTELGKREHILDDFIDMSSWTALAYHFQASCHVRSAYALLIAFIAPA